MKKAIALVAILLAGVLIAQSSDRFSADFTEAERLLGRQDYNQAYAIYNRLIKEAEGRGFGAEIKYRTAQCSYNLGRYEVAVSLLEKILTQDIPSDSRYAYLTPQVKFSLGLCYFQVGDDQRAQRYLDEAAELGGMGIADYLLRKDYKTAFDHLRDMEYPVDKLYLARSLINSREPQYLSDILSLLTQLSENAALEELVDFSRAEMQFFNRDYTTSKTVFRDFMTKYQKSALRDFAEYYLACTYYHDNEYRYAIDLLSKLTDPNKSGYVLAAHAYFMRGEAYRALSLPDSAMFSFEMARTVAPNSMVDFYTTYRLYQIHRIEGNIEFARREASRMGSIALYGQEQQLMEDLSSLVRGNIEFDQLNYIQAINYYQQVTTGLPEPGASPEGLFVYEASMVMNLLALNRQNDRASFQAASTKPQIYIRDFPDSIDVEYGGDWRAYLLYNMADATYYSAYRPNGDVKTANLKRREEAFSQYQDIVSDYGNAYITTLAKVSLAWYLLEAGRFDEATDAFQNVIDNTRKTDALVLAAYGQGLSNFYKASTDRNLSQADRNNLYLGASNWFFDEESYSSQLRITVNRKDVTPQVKYNEIADSLIERNLFWKARCLENAGYFGNALEIYKHIADAYPDRPKAGDSYQKIIEFFMRAREIANAENAVEEVKRKMTVNPRIYRNPYGYGLASLFDYYQGSGNEDMAETYAKRLTSELGTTEAIEQLYYLQALRDTSTSQIGHLREMIAKIEARNNRSKFLPELLYNLSYLLIQDKNYDEAQEVLVKFRNWPDANATKDFMADAIFMLGRVFVETNKFSDAKTQFDSWLRTYETGDNARPDLAPSVYFNLAWSYYNMGEQETNPQARAGHYRNALAKFEKLKADYADSDFYEKAEKNINDLIVDCRRKIG